MPVVGKLVEVQVMQTDRGVWISWLSIVVGAPLPASFSPERIAI
jgi:hypothetical protein